MKIKDYLEQNILLLDGAMGTYYSSLCKQMNANCESANLTNPDMILHIHKEYLAVGCNAIKTNTFGANTVNYHDNLPLLEQTITAAWNLANTAARDQAFVFADIGPIEETETTVVAAEYKKTVDYFLKLGAMHFLFETNSTDTGLVETAAYIKSVQPDAFIMVSFAAQPDGYTREGLHYATLFEHMADCKDIDAFGLNCVSGARHMRHLLEQTDLSGLTISAMPNAGYPVVINNRTFYDGDPEYFMQQLLEIASTGVSILGGCCGTTPAHLAGIRDALDSMQDQSEPLTMQSLRKPQHELPGNRLWEKISRGEKVIAVELDPPKDFNLDRFMESAKRLQTAGIDLLTIADCPIARARMDSSIIACKVKRELDLDTLPHMTCRDRNLNATKALLLGLYCEGVRNVLAVTGDPIPTAERDEVKSVFQFNSRKLARYIGSLNEHDFPVPMKIFGALNVNALRFDVELKRAKEKVENGMVMFLTQPILTPQAFENLKLARETLNAKILGGIIPVVSERNALFMQSEVNGIDVSPEIISLYANKDREESEALALDISAEIAKRIAPYVDGYYLMTPFNRVSLMERIIHEIS